MQTDLLTAHAEPEVGEKLQIDQMPTPSTALSSTVNTYTRIEWINREVTTAEKHVIPWRDSAKECVRFVAGNQLDDATRAELKGSRRPDTAINITQKYLAYVSGLQSRSPQATIFRPTVVDERLQQMLGEYVTQGFEWAYRLSRGKFTVNRVFEDMLATGLGWSDKYLDKLRDPRGLMQYVRVPWDETLWPECEDDNLSTTRWRARETWLERDEALRRWPKHSGLIMAAAGNADSSRTLPQQDITTYTIPYVQSVPIDKSGQSPDKRGKVRVLQFQWYDDQDGYAFEDPVTQETTWLSPADFRTYERRLMILAPGVRLKSDRAHHRVVQVVHLLDRKYELAPPARLPGDMFTLQALTGHWDYSQRQWYGFVRLLMDPQRYANSFFRQALEVIAVQAKGGYMAQSDAFRNQSQLTDFRKNSSKPGSVDIVAPEALEKSKILPKKPGDFPQAAMAMLNFCIQSLDVVTGLSAASMGIDQQPGELYGVTMRQGQQIGRVILAKEFDQLDLYRQEEGRSIFSFLQLMADGRLVRIGGEWSSQVVQLIRRPFLLDYDLWLDDTDRDPNMRQAYMNFILQAGPMFAKAGLFVPEMLEYLPFPAKVRQKMIDQMLAQQKTEADAAAKGINLHGRGQPRDPRETAAKTAKLETAAALQAARAANVGRVESRQDFKAVVDAMSTLQRTTHEGERTKLERDRLGLDHRRALADKLTELLGMLQQQGAGTEEGETEEGAAA